MTRVTVSGRIDAGKLIIDRDAFAAQIARLPDGEVVVKVQGQTRSQAQNRLYWMYLSIIEGVTGYSRDELHLLFRVKFNARTVSEADPTTGEIVDVEESYPSTTELDTGAFTAYLDAIKRFSAEFLGVILPDPDAPSESSAVGSDASVPPPG